MATYDLASTSTLLDIAKSYHNKQLLACAELLDKKKGFLRVAKWMEANGITNHVFSKRVALASGTWRGMNEGIVSTNPQKQQEVEFLSYLEDRSEIDVMAGDVEPNFMQRRYQEDMAHLEGLGQQLSTAMWYSNPATDVKAPKGIQPRYNTTGLSNVHSQGGSDAGAVTSLYIVQFGNQKVNLLYPREKGASIVNMEDKGEQLVVTSTTTGAALYKWVTRFWLSAGLCIEDDRAVQRVCNIGTDGADEVDLDLVAWALKCLPDPEDLSNTYLFGNRLGLYQIEKWMRNRPNIVTQDKDAYGRPMTRVFGVEMVLDEQIVNTETVVTA